MRPTDENAGVPIALAIRPNWIVWKLIGRAGRVTKLPFNPLTLRLASTTNPADWTTLANARTALATRDFSGLGFVFKRGDGVFGIDLDSCYPSLFNLAGWAEEIIRTMDTYAETSPSGSGVKLFGLGNFDRKGTVKIIDPPSEGTKRAAVEIYGWGRFFAFTGRKLDDVPAELVERQKKLDGLVELLSPGDYRAATSSVPVTRSTPSSVPLIERGRAYLQKVPFTKCGSATCSKRTFRAAYVLVKEIGVDHDTAFALLRSWADRGEHPWSDAELQHKIQSAAAQ